MMDNVEVLILLQLIADRIILLSVMLGVILLYDVLKDMYKGGRK